MIIKRWLWLILLPLALEAAPPIQHWQTDNGVRVYFIEAPDLPMVDVRIVFDAGSARDGEKAGLAALTNALLDEGAGDLDADAIAEGIESRGATLELGSARDMAWIAVRSLNTPSLLEPVADILAWMLKAPTFPEKALQREKDAMLIALKDMEESPASLAERAFYQAVYGRHPYASPPEGKEDTLKALTRRDVVAFHRRFYGARNAVLAIVGALSREQAEALARRLTKGLPPGAPAPPLPPVPEPEKPSKVFIGRDTTQTHLRMGQPGMSRKDPDYFPLYVGNHVLGGGGLVSRLSERIREAEGLSYSVYSYFIPMRRKGPFIMGAQTKNEKADRTLELMENTLRDFVAHGPTEEELTASKKNIIGGFPLRIDTNKEQVEYLAMIGFYDLPLDYLDTFTKRVEAVTLEAVKDAFRRRIHPDRMVTVRVGKER
ncbi:MAG: insulinase family protein [Gammaproteobacteria bacterium]|nr:MAG: insulinase family protein [Gammaproteobacteria bacterium]